MVQAHQHFRKILRKINDNLMFMYYNLPQNKSKITMTDIELLNNKIDKLAETLDAFQTSTEKHFEQIEKRLERMETRIYRMEDQQSEDRKILMDLWQDRNQVTVKFSKVFTGINALISAIVSGTITLLVQRN